VNLEFSMFLQVADSMTKSTLKTIIFISLILFLSVFPRVWNLSEKPPIIVDEHANIRMLKEVIEKGEFDITKFHWDFSKTILSYYPTIFLFQILGPRNHLLALRLTSVIFSLLALLPFYLIVKKLTDDKIAFITTLLFSYSYFFLQFSRVGWVDITSVITVGLYLFLFLNLGLRSLTKRSNFWIATSGIISGLIFYAYRSGIIYITLSLFYLATSLYLKKVEFKRALKYLLIFISTFIITITPWVIKTSQNLDKYNLRARVVDIRNVNIPYHGLTDKKDIYKYQITTSVKSWLLLESIDGGGSENPRYLPLKVPPLNILVRVSFWIGSLIIILNKKHFQKMYVWLLIILVTILLGQVLTVDPPNGARALIALPSYYIISSITFSQVYVKSHKNKFVLAALIFLAFFFSLYDLYTYQLWMEWIRV